MLEAFRSTWVATRSPAPFDAPFVVRFMEMIARTGAVDVLLKAMRRPGALGIIFSRKRLHELLKSLAGRGEVRRGCWGFGQGEKRLVGVGTPLHWVASLEAVKLTKQ